MAGLFAPMGSKALGAGTGMPAVAGNVAQVAKNTTGFAGPQGSIVSPIGNQAQVQKNTTGFAPTGVAGPSQSPPASNFAPGSFSAQVTKNTGATAPGAGGAPGAPTPVAPALTAQQQYEAELQADPAYAAAANDATLAANNAGAARTAAIRSAILQYGGLPTGFTDQYGDADQATLQAAAANPYSQLAQENRGYQQGVEQSRQAEAATGGDSGQIPTDIGNENYSQGLNLYNLANQFGSTVNSAIGSYTGVLDNNRTSLANALATAEQNEQTNPAYLGQGGAPSKVSPSGGKTTVQPNGGNAHPQITLPTRIGGTYKFNPSPALRVSSTSIHRRQLA